MNADLPTLLILDEALCAEAERLATGARIHNAMGHIGIYRTNVARAGRLVEFIRSTGDAVRREQVLGDLHACLELATRYETTLRAFVAKQRLLAVGQSGP